MLKSAAVFAICVLIIFTFGCRTESDVQQGRTSDQDDTDDDSDSSGAPKKPTELVASAEPEAIWLSWCDNSDNEEGFRVYSRDATVDDSPYIAITEVGMNVTQYYHYVGPEQSVEYYVVAFNRYGESDRSNTASDKTRPNTPIITYTECRCQGLEWCKLIVGWGDGRVEDGYKLKVDGEEHCNCTESCLPCECTGGTFFGCWVTAERFFPLTSHQIEVFTYNDVGEATGYSFIQCPPP